MTFDIIQKSKKIGEREVWSFNVFDFNIVLIGYSLQSKTPTQRKWRYSTYWNKYARRNSIESPKEIPLEVSEAAKRKVNSLIKVSTWDEWKK